MVLTCFRKHDFWFWREKRYPVLAGNTISGFDGVEKLDFTVLAENKKNTVLVGKHYFKALVGKHIFLGLTRKHNFLDLTGNCGFSVFGKKYNFWF